MRLRAVWAAALLLSAAGTCASAPAELKALITEPRLGEISGLAVSHRHGGILWAHNDGGNAPELHAIDVSGKLLATLHVAGIRNVDWEDMASFEWEGKPYLLVADVGDNGGLRHELRLRVIEEPAKLRDARVSVAWTVQFRWPDGPRDCESVAVDVREGAVYLVSKKRVPPELFRVPLRAGKRVVTAERVGVLTGIDQPSADELQRNPVYGRYRAQITAADIASDGSHFAALNYLRVYVWPRDPGGWGAATAKPPRVYDFPWIPQAEALGFDLTSDSVWISSERLPAPLLRLPLVD